MAHHRFGRTRSGVSLIELILALVLLAIGATALAGGMRAAARSAGMGRAWTSGALAAESRLEALRARCTLSAGSASGGAVSERWSVGAPAGTMLPSLDVEDSITMTVAAGSGVGRVVRSIVRCVP